MDKKAKLIDKLKKDKMTLNQNAGLYHTMVIKNTIYSKTDEEIKNMFEFKDNLENESKHIDFKLENCLSCSRVNECKKKC